MKGIDSLVKILWVFFKILSQWTRKGGKRKDKKLKSLEVREARSSHLKTKLFRYLKGIP